MQAFFDHIRAEFGTLLQSQVDGISSILEEYRRLELSDKRYLAYILATVKHETANKYQPVKEYGGEAYLRSKKYYPYYGRDLVHTTWKANYEKVKAFSGIDVVTHPELIGELNLAVKVAFHFMIKGLYTGKKLSNYFNDEKTDWINARRIINGVDCAEKIAGYGKTFYEALADFS